MENYSIKQASINFVETSLGFQDQIPHSHCSCIHCVNNTKPLIKSKPPRIVSKKQNKLNDSHAFRLILKQMAQHGFVGHVLAADTFLIESSNLIYSSKSGKMRIKQGQTNLQIKRHFDDQRRRTQTNISNINIASSMLGKIALTQSIPSINTFASKFPKEVAIMAYKDNTQQIINQPLLNKIFQKRKNDPFWEEISHILQIPIDLRQPIQKYKYHYQRTEQTLLQLNPVIQKTGRLVDSIQQKSMIRQTAKGQSKFNQQDIDINPQMKLQKPSSQKVNRKNSTIQFSPKAKKNLSLQEYANYSLISGFQQKLQELQTSSLQIVAFLEVACQMRILNIIFEYFIDEKGNIFLSNTKEVISQHLQPSQLTLIHNRYQPLQQIGIQELVIAKHHFDKKEEQELWKICSAVVNQCLQIRKIQLNLVDYKKPTNQTLLKIFLKIFPNFKSESIFSSMNWKNDLNNYVADIRKKINKIIRQDEGIRILRRFNIQFRRTFH